MRGNLSQAPLTLGTRVIVTMRSEKAAGTIYARSFDDPCHYDVKLDTGERVTNIPGPDVRRELESALAPACGC